MPTPTPALVEHFFRHEYAKLVASLTRRFGVRHLGLAEDAVQAALERALRSWSLRGVPDNPAAWLHQVAYRHALDCLRRDLRWTPLHVSRSADWPATPPPPLVEAEVQDDLLRMIFVCCDPVLSQEHMVALALKTLCGFGPTEIARAFLTTEANVLKRITRAKERLRAASIDPTALSADDIRTRLPDALAVVYLLFNEGYSSTQPDQVIREDLCEEAVRLALLLAEHPLTAGTETAAFLALLLFHAGRLAGRTSATGDLCLLEDQDRSVWDWRLLAEGFRWLARATTGEVVTRYHAEAWIAAEHCRATDFEHTDWAAIVDAYDLLLKLAPSPVHQLNRAIAISRRDGVEAGQLALAQIPPGHVPDTYYLWHATLAEFARASGDEAAARASLLRARDLAPTVAERDLLDRRLAGVS
jgi:RNA polymerase sigma-70 factor (ECF subfamily)